MILNLDDRGKATLVATNDNYTHAAAINLFAADCHAASRKAGWYTNLATGKALDRNVPEMLCLIHSEISEAMEGYRKNLQDDKLPHRKMIEVELADALIRIGDLATFLGLDVGGAVVEKMAFNASREDHKIESRKAAGGKAF
jgi:NTP pyrophosphatase (non-canonical NTP hydrolase)